MVLTVETRSGTVRGVAADGAILFAGIPYAAPPLGALRFHPPQPVTPWTGVRQALSFGRVAMQDLTARPDDAPPIDGYADMCPGMGEDCLVLNVWTRATGGGPRPVMVWVHGGAYRSGAGRGVWTDGTMLAREEDVVVVSFNHRLHAFGFLSLADVGGDEYTESENVGMLDVIAVLRWVRDNIDAFGGDPDNVTVFGQSGGGWKISALLAMPAAQGLFHRGIIQSGSDIHAVGAEHADRQARLLLTKLEIPENKPQRIVDVPAAAIVAATRQVYPKAHPATIHSDGTWTWNFNFAPVVDDQTLTQSRVSPVAPPSTGGIPLLIGTTRHEYGAVAGGATVPDLRGPVEKAMRLGMDDFTARRITAVYRTEEPQRDDDDLFGELMSDTLFLMQAIRQAEAMQAVAPVHMYLFSWPWHRAGNRAVHAADVPFVFDNLGPEVLGTDRDDSTRALARRMRAAWATFARTGDPSHPGLPPWPAYTPTERATMVFDHESRLENDPRAPRRRALSGE